MHGCTGSFGLTMYIRLNGGFSASAGHAGGQRKYLHSSSLVVDVVNLCKRWDGDAEKDEDRADWFLEQSPEPNASFPRSSTSFGIRFSTEEGSCAFVGSVLGAA